jgi:hypothetical protein
VRLRLADLRLGGVQAQLNAAGVGVGDHVGQGPQAQARLAGDGEAAGGQRRPDLVDGAGDGGAIHPVQHRQGLVRELEAQNHEGHQDPVAEDQPVAGSASFGTLPQVTSALLQRALVGGRPWACEFGDQRAKVCRESPVKQGWDRAARTHADVDTRA